MRLLRFCLTTLSDWFEKLALLSEPIIYFLNFLNHNIYNNFKPLQKQSVSLLINKEGVFLRHGFWNLAIGRLYLSFTLFVCSFVYLISHFFFNLFTH